MTILLILSLLIHNQDKDLYTINVHSLLSILPHNVISSNKLICLKKILKQQQRKSRVTAEVQHMECLISIPNQLPGLDLLPYQISSYHMARLHNTETGQ